MKAIKLMIALGLVVGAITVGALYGSQTTLAQTGGNYDLTWNTIDGGGQMFSTGGSFTLGGTVGQTDAGVLQGGAFTLMGGFWAGAPTATLSNHIFLPLVMKG